MPEDRTNDEEKAKPLLFALRPAKFGCTTGRDHGGTARPSAPGGQKQSRRQRSMSASNSSEPGMCASSYRLTLIQEPATIQLARRQNDASRQASCRPSAFPVRRGSHRRVCRHATHGRWTCWEMVGLASRVVRGSEPLPSASRIASCISSSAGHVTQDGYSIRRPRPRAWTASIGWQRTRKVPGSAG